MKKKYIIIIIGIILIVGIVIFLLRPNIFNIIFSSQYNDKGVSHFLVITIDESQEKEYVGDLDGYKIYIEKLNLEETNFRNVKAENVSIKKALKEKLVSIEEWKKYAWNIVKDGDSEILKFENYEISCTYDDCIIRPLSR